MRDPGIRAFDEPSSGEDVKAFGNDLIPVHFLPHRSRGALDASPRMSDDFHTDPSEMFFDPVLKGPLIGAISPHEPETREGSDQRREQDLAPFPIREVGSQHFDQEQQTRGVHRAGAVACREFCFPPS